MATAATIISRAMRLLGVLESGGTASSDELADGLTALNAMIDSWNNDRLAIYALQDESLTLVSGTGSYTIGSGGDLNTTRPVAIESAYVRVSSLDYPVEVYRDKKSYTAIIDKTAQSSFPEICYYETSMSTGRLYVYPVPDAANVMHLITRVPFTAFASTATTVTLPPGYEQALATNLAINLSPEFQVPVPAVVVEMARAALAGIKKVNSRPILAADDFSQMFSRNRSNIITDRA